MRDSFLVTLPDAYLVEIGKITVQWSALENVFDLCGIKLLGMDGGEPRAWAVFAHVTFAQRLDMFGAILDSLQSGYPKLQDYKTILTLVKEAQTARNKVIHARWLYENGVVKIMRLTARGKVKTSSEPITTDDLKGTAELIGRASVQVWKLVVAGGADDGNTSKE